MLRRLIVAVTSVLVLAVALFTVGAGSASTAATSFKVTSTIDGKKELPLRIRWRATPHISTSKVKRSSS